MKKLLIVLACLLLSAPAMAATLMWDQPGNADGFIVYSRVQGSTDPPWIQTINDGTARTFDIDEQRYQPGQTYEFWMRAYNALTVSEDSMIADYTPLAYEPPEDNQPPIVISAPGPVTTITITVE